MDKKRFTDAIAQPPSSEVIAEWNRAASFHDCLSNELRDSIPLEHVVSKLQTLLGLRKTDAFVPVASSAEGVMHVLHGVYKDVVMRYGKNQIIYLGSDEAPIQLGIESLEAQHVIGKKLDGARLTKEALEAAINPRTALVSLSLAHGLTGLVQPLFDIASVCEEKGILLHVDISTALGKQYFSFADLPIDYITLDGARIGAPAGTGLLVMQRGSILPPLIPDVLQHDGMRGGMFDYPGFAALVKAIEEKEELIDHTCLEGVRLRDLFEQLLTFPKTVLCKDAERLPTTTAIAVKDLHANLFVHALAENGIIATRGGGIYPELPENALSFTLPKEATEAFIKEAAETMNETFRTLEKGALL